MKSTLILVFVGMAFAQTYTPPITNPMDGFMPQTLRGSDPAAVYQLSGLDQVNYFNGTLPFSLPLYTLAGRGQASHTLTLGIKPPVWTVDTSLKQDNQVPSGSQTYYRTFNSDPVEDGYVPYQAGYGPGVVSVRRSGEKVGSCGTGGSTVYGRNFTYLVFSASGGAEYELYDTVTTGNGVVTVNGADCELVPNLAQGRGTVFKDRTGLGITFVSDSPIYDDVIYNPNSDASRSAPPPNGWLYFADGRKAWTESGRIMKLLDRNGNRMDFCYSPCTFNSTENRWVSGNQTKVERIWDPDKREVQVEYDVTVSDYGVVDRLSFYGNAAAAAAGKKHQILVKYGTVSSALTGGGSGVLFPELETSPNVSGRIVPVAVYLPNSTSTLPSYTFKYTRYGELGEVSLPSGGKMTYEYGAGVDCNNVSGCYASGQILQTVYPAAFMWTSSGTPPERPSFGPIIYRRLLARREYSDGVNLSRTTLIARPEKALSSATQTYYSATGSQSVERIGSVSIAALNFVETSDEVTGVASPIVTRHYFHGGSNLEQAGSSGWIPGALNTEDQGFAAYAGNPGLWANDGPVKDLYIKEQGTSDRIIGFPAGYLGKEYRTDIVGLRRSERAYGPAGNGLDVCQENTQLLSGSSTKQSGAASYYDANGNVTDAYEFDFDNAPAIATASESGGYFRRTCVAKDALNTAQQFARRTERQYDTSAWAAPSHLLRLLTTERVFGPAGGEAVSEVNLVYDGSARSAISGLTGWEDPATRYGNPAQIKRRRRDLWTETGWNENAADVVETRGYDVAGNVVSVLDALNRSTTYDYSASCAGAAPSGNGAGTYLKKVTLPAANGVSLTKEWTTDCYLGKPLSFIDVNGPSWSFAYEAEVNKLSRLTRSSDS